MINQTVLPFKLEKGNNSISKHAGLTLLGEVRIGVGRVETTNQNFPPPGGGASYQAGFRFLTGTTERNTRVRRYCVGIAERRTL
jgi:hypothetical protein